MSNFDVPGGSILDCLLSVFHPRVHTHRRTIDLWPTVNCQSKLTLPPYDTGRVCYPESDFFQNCIYDGFDELCKLCDTNNCIECWQKFMKFATTTEPCIALNVCYNNKIIKVIICKFITGRNIRCKWTKFSCLGDLVPSICAPFDLSIFVILLYIEQFHSSDVWVFMVNYGLFCSHHNTYCFENKVFSWSLKVVLIPRINTVYCWICLKCAWLFIMKLMNICIHMEEVWYLVSETVPCEFIHFAPNIFLTISFVE